VNEQLTRLFELPIGVKIGVVAGLILAIGGGFYFGFYSGLLEEELALKAAIEGPKGLKTQVRELQALANNLAKIEEEVANLDVELEKAMNELPDKKAIGVLLSRISGKARDAGLEILLFKPQAEAKKDFYAEVPVDIEVSGSYHQVATFFDEVGNMERIVNIDRINMTDPERTEDRMTLKTKFVATTFRFLEESERPKPDREKEGRRHKRKAASEE
jgi:type IV pilus assembly protein PilO